jgi:hypothetical protein
MNILFLVFLKKIFLFSCQTSSLELEEIFLKQTKDCLISIKEEKREKINNIINT